MYEEAGLGLCAFAGALVGLAFGVVLELRWRRHILRGIGADAAVLLRLLVESRSHLALESLGLGLELARHLGIEVALYLRVKIAGEALGRRRRRCLRVLYPLRPITRPSPVPAVLRPVMLRPIVFRPIRILHPSHPISISMLHDRVND